MSVFFITNRNSVFVGEELAPPVASNLTFLTTLANPVLSLSSYYHTEFAFSDLIFREGKPAPLQILKQFNKPQNKNRHDFYIVAINFILFSTRL